MGQATSKATTEAVKTAVKRRTPPPISNTNNIISRTVMVMEQQQNDSNVKMPPPPASASAFDSVGRSFIANTNNRAQQHQADTARRIAHAASSRSSTSSDDHDDDDQNLMLELPPDLLKFLNDAGPVTRTIDKQLTSPRVYDSLVNDENMVREHARQANTRVRRRMPIVSSSSSSVSSRGDGNASSGDAMEQEEMDGTMTERTTNFSSNTSVSSNRSSSSSALSSSHNNYLAVSRHDFFDLSIKLQGVTVDSPEWKKLIHDQYEDIVKKNESKSNSQKEGIVDSGTTKGGFDQLRDLALLENSARFIGVPVLMKDTEGDIIGMWHNKVMDMKHSLGLKAVRENSLQFVMQNEDGVKGGM